MSHSNPVQSQKHKLAGSGVTSTATTITVQTLDLPDGTDITMSDFGDIGYATLEPATSKEENISFTGITQNADDTADLTGVTRGLNFVSPYGEQASLKKAHAGGSILVFSNSSPFYDEFVRNDADETITGQHTFDDAAIPRLDAYAAPTADEEFAPKKYVDDTAFGGSISINRIAVAATAGESISAGDILFLNTADGEWYQASASTASEVNETLLGIAQGSGTDGNAVSGGVLLKGLDTNQSGMTGGTIMFVADTAGSISSSAGTNERAIGIARNTTDLYFDAYFQYMPTADEKDALAGTGTPNSTNTYVTDDDTSNSSTADKVVRYTAGGDVNVPTTPGAANDAASKSYVDAATGYAFASGSTSTSGNQTFTHNLGVTPSYMRFTAYFDNGDQFMSVGVATGTAAGAQRALGYVQSGGTAPHANDYSSRVLVQIATDGTVATDASVSSVDSSDIVINWSSAPNGEAHVIVEAFA